MSLPRVLIAASFLAAALLALPRVGSAAALDDITAANKAGKTVFLVVTDAAGKNLAGARSVAKQAMQKTKNSVVLELNRSDPAQVAAVRGYRVAGAPVPIVMVIAPNGVGAGASLVKKGALARLLRLVPTPGKARYLKLLSQRQTALVVFSHGRMKQESALFSEVSKTVTNGKGKISAVLVDVTSPAEQKFLREWKIDPKSTQPTLIVMNPKGQTLGRFAGVTKTAQILATTKKKPCCGDPSCKGCK
jgi:hypothetical protein